MKAHVVMMCGCPVGPQELWDSRNYSIQTQIRRGHESVAEFPLPFTGTLSRFAVYFAPRELGAYETGFSVADPQQNNISSGLTTFVVQ